MCVPIQGGLYQLCCAVPCRAEQARDCGTARGGIEDEERQPFNVPKLYLGITKQFSSITDTGHSLPQDVVLAKTGSSTKDTNHAIDDLLWSDATQQRRSVLVGGQFATVVPSQR